jgi:hypothetical protein
VTVERAIEVFEELRTKQEAFREAQRRGEAYDDWKLVTPDEVHAQAVSVLLACVDDPRITAAFDAVTARRGW